MSVLIYTFRGCKGKVASWPWIVDRSTEARLINQSVHGLRAMCRAYPQGSSSRQIDHVKGYRALVPLGLANSQWEWI